MGKWNIIKDKDGKIIPKNIFWIACIGVVLVCALYIVLMFFIPIKSPVNMEPRGAFGDMFGAVGALFSGLAFAGLIVTMLQQREDLQNQKDEIKLQRDEIELQRKDLEAQTEALKLQKEEIAQTNKELQLQRTEMKVQNKTIMQQRFEATFFKVLTMLQENFKNVHYGVYVGYSALDSIYNQLRQLTVERTPESDDYVGIYVSIVERTNLHLYYDTLSFVLHLIDSSDFLTEDEKHSYASVLKTKLSKYELLLLFYEGLTDSNESIHFVNHEYHFKYYIEKYSLFKNIRFDLLLKPIHERLYSEKAYGSAYKYRSEV